jgi:hypothetical protein
MFRTLPAKEAGRTAIFVKYMKKYWLRGGISGLIFGLILYVGLFLVAATGVHDISDTYGIIAEKIFNLFAHISLIIPLDRAGFSPGETFIISGIYTFVLGAIIGFIYGKIKPISQK